jgi:antitoxin ParD1/3/4
MKQFVDEQVSSGGYGSASEYIRRLIGEEQKRKDREEIDRKLLEALNGGTSTPLTSQDWDEIRREVRERRLPSEPRPSGSGGALAAP